MAVVNDLPTASGSFVKLNYIQGQGSQYIDAGFYSNGRTEFECKWNNMRATSTSNTDMSMFGARNNYNDNQFQLTDFANDSVTGYLGLSRDSLRRYDLHYAGNTDIITSWRNGVITTGTGYTYSVAPDDWVQNFRLIIFGSRNSSWTAGEIATFRLYYLKFWYNGMLIKDFIPVRKLSNGEVCLYDKVGKLFYTNQGTGSFIGG